jgi:hypothetical protein
MFREIFFPIFVGNRDSTSNLGSGGLGPLVWPKKGSVQTVLNGLAKLLYRFDKWDVQHCNWGRVWVAFLKLPALPGEAPQTNKRLSILNQSGDIIPIAAKQIHCIAFVRFYHFGYMHDKIRIFFLLKTHFPKCTCDFGHLRFSDIILLNSE